MTAQACIDAIRRIMGGDATEADTGAVFERLAQRAEAVQRRQGGTVAYPDAFTTAAKELSDEARLAAAIEHRNALLNLQARTARRARLTATADPVLAMQAEIHGVNTPLRGARFSAEAEGKALANVYTSGVVGELDRAGLLSAARTGAIERDWVRELAELNKSEGGRPGISGNKEARQLADILHRYQAMAKNGLNDAGAWVGDYDGYVSRTAHDPDRIRRAGYEAWRAAALAGLDKDRTFQDVDEPEKFLRGVYNGLVTGVHLSIDGGEGMKDPAFSGPGNLARRLSQERVLHWRSPEAWLDYQRQFGEGNAFAAVMHSLDRAARETALMRRWGTNPRAEFQADLRWLQEHYRDANPDAVLRLRSNLNSLQNRFDFLDGTANMPVNRLGARVGSATRVIESMAKLGGVAFTHLSSIGSKAAELRYHGIGFLERYGDGLESFLRGRGVKGSGTREVMDLLGAGMEGMQRDLLSRFEPDDTAPGVLSKLANTFFKWTGLTYLMNAQKAGAEFVLSRHLGAMLDKPHDVLPAATQRLLGLYRIDPAEWEALRGVPDHAAIGERRFLTPDAAMRLPAGASPDLAMRLHALFHDVAERAIVTPGIPERALLLGGTRPGTLWGEALRFIAQFKQWPAAAIRQGLGRELYGGQTKPAAIAGILHMAVASMVTGYLAMTLKDLTKGRTPRDPRDPKTWAAAMMQGGGFGILGDYLFGDYNRFGQNFAETALGPVLGQGASTAIDLWNRLKNGQDLAPEAFRAFLDNTPFVNLFYTRAALNYLFLYQIQEALNPGYLRRYERRIEQQNGQGFWLRPTDAARLGNAGRHASNDAGQVPGPQLASAPQPAGAPPAPMRTAAASAAPTPAPPTRQTAADLAGAQAYREASGKAGAPIMNA